MADNLDARAKLSLQLDGLDQAIRTMDQAVQTGGDVDKAWERVQKTFSGVQREAKGAAASVDKAGTQATGAAKGWKELEDRVKGVADAAGIKSAEAALPRLRYALYDVATTAGIASTAITGLGIASVAAFASMESSFTNVERTLDGIADPQKVQALRAELVGLSREIPLTFGNIAEIATLGNQLGIASEDIAAFSETTAKFSAVTGLTAEASAQAFGSLGELLNVNARDYEALGSSIALVGRRSVATEQEIVAMTTRLAASATNAGFTAQQVIALSGAFASLRIAPERAQGVMEVYFKQLNTAIAEGGDRLDAFARVAGVTSSEVENLVRSDPTAFFQRLATGLGQMDQIAQTGALADLGLQGIRAGEVFGRVSANVEVFNKALTDANQGWTEGTELGDQYAKVVDDLASRWQIFLNAVTEAGAAVGAVLAPALGGLLEFLTKVLQGFADFASDGSFGTFATGALIAVAAIVAGITGLVAVGALGVASMVALSTAMAEMTKMTGVAGFGLRGLSAGITAVGASAGFSAGAIRIFKGALIGTGFGAIAVLLGSIGEAFFLAGEGAGKFSAEAQQMGESLNRAIAADTAEFEKTGEAISTYSRKLEEATPAADGAAKAAAEYAGVQSDTADGVDAATKKIEEQTVALGKNSEEYFRNQLAKDEDFQKLASDPALRAAAEKAGFTMGELVASGMKAQGGFTAYVESIRAEAERLKMSIPTDTTQWDAATYAMIEQRDNLYAVANALDGYASKMDESRAASDVLAASMEYAGAKGEDAAGGIRNAGDAAEEVADKMWASQQAALDMEGALYRLGSTVGENAGMWDVYSEGGRENLGALYGVLDQIEAKTRGLGGNNAAVAAEFAGLYNALIQGGVATANQLSWLKAKIDELAGAAAVSFSSLQLSAARAVNPLGAIGMTLHNATNGVPKATTQFGNLFNGIQTGSEKAAKALGGGGGGGKGGGVAKAVRTLLDYARDLEGVFKRAFDLRFGNQGALDEITSGWRDIAKSNEEARQSIREYKAELAELTADRAIKKYWLSVAENYGDELRANKLRAEIAETDADIAKKKKDLTKAQDENSKKLEGNSDAAIKNRGTIRDMLGTYRDLLAEYAANGMSQDQLKRKAAQLKEEFIRQAVQLGYSRSEVAKYARSFDDMGVAIGRIPRNITVKASTNPALQALREFEAKAREAGTRAGKAFSGGFGGASGGLGRNMDKAARGMQLMAEIAILQMKIVRNPLMGAAWMISLAHKVAKLNSGNYWTGGFVGDGYTGDGGKYEPKGVVHGGEFVFSKAATSFLGKNNLAYMHSMAKQGKMVAPVGLGASGPGVVDLSAASIRALAGAISGQLTVVLPGSQLAGSIGSHNVVNGFRGGA